jgi:fermentation-respiration switch protein FrsA (DUF1100 family)
MTVPSQVPVPAASPVGVILLVLAGMLVLYGAVLATLYAFQRRILFRPDPGQPLIHLVGVPSLTEIRIPAAAGPALLVWWQPPAAGAPVVLYCHGNAGHIGHRGDRIRRFAALGWGVLMPEYRGYGGNPGTPSEAGLIADAAAALANLRARGIPGSRIVLWGESLGSGVVVALAGQAGPAIGAVVLETPFTSIADIAKARYRFAPVDLLLKDRFDSLARIAAIRAPILVATAGRDTIVAPEMGRVLVSAAVAPTELWHADAAGHTELVEHGLTEAAAEFLARHLPANEPVGENIAP